MTISRDTLKDIAGITGIVFAGVGSLVLSIGLLANSGFGCITGLTLLVLGYIGVERSI